jgi:hypothetical protein
MICSSLNLLRFISGPLSCGPDSSKAGEPWRRIGRLLDAFPPRECANYLRAAEYAT